MENIIIEEENFHEGGAGFSSIKKNEKLNKKKVFSKPTEIITYMRGFPPSIPHSLC